MSLSKYDFSDLYNILHGLPFLLFSMFLCNSDWCKCEIYLYVGPNLCALYTQVIIMGLLYFKENGCDESIYFFVL